MAKQIRYTVEVTFQGNTLYYRRDVNGVTYDILENASSTTDFYELATWQEYVKNDFDNGSVTAFSVVELELKVKNANVQPEMDAAVIDRATGKLTQLEREALGV